jgi:predicted lipid-binding transport protein (Tim44 family)
VHPYDPRRKPSDRGGAGFAAPAGLCAALFAAPASGQPSDGPGLIEILIVAGLIVLVIRFFRSHSGGPDNNRDRHDLPDDEPPPQRFSMSDDPWDRLRSKPKQPARPAPGTEARNPSPTATPIAAPSVAGPAQTDDDFLRGAKMFYSRIAASLAEGDFDDLAGFCSPRALEQLKTAPRGPAEIMLLSASLVEQKQDGERITATVAYQSLERRGNETTPRERQATWVFGKPAANPAATWMLDTIVD